MIVYPGDEDESLTADEIQVLIPEFEGLLCKTASMIAPYVEIDEEDIRQRLRIKVWRGLKSYDCRRVVKKSDPQALRKYVFSCVTNEKKDILKQKRRGDVYIEDQGINRNRDRSHSDDLHDAFEVRYLSQSADEAFVDADIEPLQLPSTLTQLELQVIGLLYEGWMQTEVRTQLSLSVRAIDSLMRSIREKLADWRPSESERGPGPTPPLPRALSAQVPEPSAAAPPQPPAPRACAPTDGSAVPA